MATLEEIHQLRRMTGLSPDDPTYTAELLGTYIDNLTTLEAAAAAVWSEKAAVAANLVDVTESGSSRRLSQLAEQARQMTAHYTASAGSSAGGSFTVGIERV